MLTKGAPRKDELNLLTNLGRVTHICVSILNIIGSDNGLSPGRRQAIIWTNALSLLIGPSGTNLIEILTFSFKKMRLKVSSAKRWPFCLGLNVLIFDAILLGKHNCKYNPPLWDSCHLSFPMVQVASEGILVGNLPIRCTKVQNTKYIVL